MYMNDHEFKLMKRNKQLSNTGATGSVLERHVQYSSTRLVAAEEKKKIKKKEKEEEEGSRKKDIDTKILTIIFTTFFPTLEAEGTTKIDESRT